MNKNDKNHFTSRNYASIPVGSTAVVQSKNVDHGPMEQYKEKETITTTTDFT